MMMRRVLAFFLCFMSSVLCATFDNSFNDQWPLLAVVIMVKNEEAVIVPTLEPYLQAGIDAVLVFDTGSTDKTMEKAQELFDKYHIKHGYILQEPFIDFSASRNRAIELAEQIFREAVFFIMPDAEWYISNVPELIQFCVDEADKYDRSSYLVRIISPGIDFGTNRLFRVGKNLRFKGVVHEVLDCTPALVLPRSVYFNFPEEPKGIEVSRKRWKRDLQLLLKEYEKNPLDPRNTFYLAQTYDCLGELLDALHYYQLRANMNGWEEENFQVFYRIGYVYDRLSNEDMDNWAKGMEAYLKAYSMRPWRIEPLMRIAIHYLNTRDYLMALQFLYTSCEIPYSDDILFVEKDMWETVRFDLLNRCMKSLNLSADKAKEALGAHVAYHYLFKYGNIFLKDIPNA